MSPRRRPSKTVNPWAAQHRGFLRGAGLLFVGVGGIFAAVGLIDFFAAFGSSAMPTKFWCAFVGLPLVGIGTMLLKFGYMGTIARYVAGEAAPVARDAVNYMVDGTEEALGKAGRALRGGGEDGSGPSRVRERLEKLKKLRDDGIIDADDYEEQKDRILSEL